MEYRNSNISTSPFRTCICSETSGFGNVLFIDCPPVFSRVPAYAVMMNANFDTSRTAGS